MSGWLITGAGGMLGQDLVTLLDSRGETVIGLWRSELDITDVGAIRRSLDHWRPTVLVNCAAWTAVDDAEGHEEVARQVNGHAVAVLAALCAARGITLVQLSTDYIFDGQARQPYPEDSVPAPLTAYGRTKLAGERALLEQANLVGYVVRTAWLYGAHGSSFVGTMIGKAHGGATVRVVDDQYGQPSWTTDVAGHIASLVQAAAPPGIYHATSSGQATWFGLAQEVFRQLGADPARVSPIQSATLDRPAARPSYSVLGHAAWRHVGLAPIGDWRLALRRALPQLLAARRPLTSDQQRATEY